MGNVGSVLNSFLLSLLAGLGIGLGGLIAVLRKPGKRSFGCLMGITAGVMITLSFLDLVNEAWELQEYVTAMVGFSAGAVFMLVIDILIPHMPFGEMETKLPEILDEQDAGSRVFWKIRHRRGPLAIYRKRQGFPFKRRAHKPSVGWRCSPSLPRD